MRSLLGGEIAGILFGKIPRTNRCILILHSTIRTFYDFLSCKILKQEDTTPALLTKNTHSFKFRNYHQILTVLEKNKFKTWLMLSLEKKKNWFHWFKTIKILGTKTKLSKSSIDLNEKWENLGKVVTARNVRGRGRRLWETCAVGDGIKGRQVRARAPAKKNYDDWFCRFFCSYK